MPDKILKTFQHFKSVLCLNGDLPKPAFFSDKEVIIATDGAADQLLKIGIRPQIIIGDLDSLNHANHPESEKVYLPNQDQNDFQKALNFLAGKGLLPAIICGVDGGYLDHILNNINIVLENECVFYSNSLIGYVLANTSIKHDLPLNTKLSLFGMSSAVVTTSGLKWELNDAKLEFPGANSCFNRTIAESIRIEVLSGRLLVLVYLDPIKDMGSSDRD